jgi:hypothetical protein
MGHADGRVKEIQIGSGGKVEAYIACPPGIVPAPGQYVLAIDQNDPHSVLRTASFLVEKTSSGFWAAPLTPVSWAPGTRLDLVGPLGHGLNLPHNILRLGLVGMGETIARLAPLIRHAAHQQTGMALFTDLPVLMLPASLEVHPLDAIKEELSWPDFLVLDLPLECLPGLRAVLGHPVGRALPCPAQALITSAFPCAGLAQCGACAVPSRRGWKLVCEDGPVFDLDLLKW